MADVTGPISTLPGTQRTAPDNQDCDNHPTRRAVRRVQGETDSMGCEMYDLCQECLDEFREGQKEARIGQCDWCKQDATDLRPRRDFEEGMTGPVYDVCGACVRKQLEQLREEAGDNNEDWGN
jgi:hypothetical protein